MALKQKINKAAFDKLSDELKKEYIADGDDYKLDVEGAEDTGALKRANDRLKQEKADAEKKANEATTKLEALGEEGARKAGDIVTLEKSWDEKMKTGFAERDAKAAKLQKHIQTQLVDNVAMTIAQKLSDSPMLLIPHIKARLTADFDGENPTTRVLDASGKVSAFTPEDLQKEFATNKDFSAIIRVSKSSGAGGNGQPNPNPTGGSGYQQQQNNAPDLSRMDPVALAAKITANKAQQ